MNSDEDTLKQFIKTAKLASKKAKKEDAEVEDSMLFHDALRLCVAEGLSDAEVLRRLKQLGRG